MEDTEANRHVYKWESQFGSLLICLIDNKEWFSNMQGLNLSIFGLLKANYM